jgi:hypothetical protein
MRTVLAFLAGGIVALTILALFVAAVQHDWRKPR